MRPRLRWIQSNNRIMEIRQIVCVWLCGVAYLLRIKFNKGGGERRWILVDNCKSNNNKAGDMRVLVEWMCHVKISNADDICNVYHHIAHNIQLSYLIAMFFVYNMRRERLVVAKWREYCCFRPRKYHFG